MRKIGKITTQGGNTTYDRYVSKYTVTYSKTGVIFTGIYDIQHNEVVSLFATEFLHEEGLNVCFGSIFDSDCVIYIFCACGTKDVWWKCRPEYTCEQ